MENINREGGAGWGSHICFSTETNFSDNTQSFKYLQKIRKGAVLVE